MTIRPYKITPPLLSDTAAYGIILRPIITEKIAGLSEGNTVGFVVPLGANKSEIKAAVEKLYKVKVRRCGLWSLRARSNVFAAVSANVRTRKKPWSHLPGATVSIWHKAYNEAKRWH